MELFEEYPDDMGDWSRADYAWTMLEFIRQALMTLDDITTSDAPINASHIRAWRDICVDYGQEDIVRHPQFEGPVTRANRIREAEQQYDELGELIS